MSCETRDLTVDDVDIELDANIDATLGSVIVLTPSPDPADRDAALAEIKKQYGDAKQDPRVTTRPWRLGLIRKTDMCGRPIETPPPH